MKKSITKISVMIILAVIMLPYSGMHAQIRYLDSVFASTTVTPDVVYANNISILTGTPTATNLFMDVYEPTGDACTSRPLVIYLHAGTYLPIIYNRACVGMKT